MHFCRSCGRVFDVSVSLKMVEKKRIVKVAMCRVCPANNIYVVCERCADLNKIQQSPCPSCGAQGMWEIRGLDEVKPDKGPWYLRAVWFIYSLFHRDSD